MAGVDVHQHLWPRAFSDELARRATAPFLRGDILHLREGDYRIDLADHDLEQRLAVLDRSEIDTAVVSLQPTLGLEVLEPVERAELERTWEDGILELAAASDGRIRPLAAGRPRAGFVGVSVGATGLDELETLAPTLDALRGGGFLFVHPVSGSAPAGAPTWWPPVAEYTSQMQRAYLLWLAHAQARWPAVDVVFAILAGGGPIQLERLGSRGVDTSASTHRNLWLDTASYGPRAIRLCVEAVGIEQLVFGTDAPVVDPAHAADSLAELDESVVRHVRRENPRRLLARERASGAEVE